MMFRPALLSFALLLLGAAASAPALPPTLHCDMEEYAPRQLTWKPSAEPKQIDKVFPHPLLPSRVLAAAGSGLWISDDAGRTWTALPQASAAQIGKIQSVAFHPLEMETFYVASATKGIWSTTDAGRTFRQIGSTANGLASDAVENIIVYNGDTAHQSLLAVHGTAAGGISCTRNGGATWDVLHPDYYFRRVLGRDKNLSELFLYGSTKSEPEIQTLYHCNAPTELPVEVMRDTMITDMNFSCAREPSCLYVATADNGLQRISPTHDEITALGSKNENWVSVSPFWGPNADVIGLCLYDPSQQGLVFSTDDLATRQIFRGPLVSALVKEGAAIRSNANGTTFYAVANGALTIGYPVGTIPAVSVTPAAFEPSSDANQHFQKISDAFREFSSGTTSAAKAAMKLHEEFGDLAEPIRKAQITITARVPVTPTPPTSVTVDLSRFGGEAATALYDDGKHGDGAANDGVYGFTFCFHPLAHSALGEDWRRCYSLLWRKKGGCCRGRRRLPQDEELRFVA